MAYKYGRETMSHHVGMRMTPTDGSKLNEVAKILRLEPSALARKIVLDYVYSFDVATDKNVKR
jgi:hypothetical protein